MIWGLSLEFDPHRQAEAIHGKTGLPNSITVGRNNYHCRYWVAAADWRWNPLPPTGNRPPGRLAVTAVGVITPYL